MEVDILKSKTTKLNEETIDNSYAMYLHKFVEVCGNGITDALQMDCAIMTYDEFKEYYILKVLGRSAEFTQNIARDYQYLTFDCFSQLTV